MITVANYTTSFLNFSEIFVYRYLRAFSAIHPIVLTTKKLNEKYFPFEPVYEILLSRRRLIRIWLMTMIHKHLLNDNYWVWRASRVLKNENVNVLHVYDGTAAYNVLELKIALGIPLVVTFWGRDMSVILRDDVWLDRYKDLFKEGDLFLVEGSKMREGLLALGAPPEKTKIQHWAVDPDDYPFRLRQTKGRWQKIKILFVGRFVEKKGLIYALEAISSLHSEYQHLEFRVVGNGPLSPQIETFIREHSMDLYTKLLGMQPHPFVMKEMESADLFIHPSVTASDGDTEGGAPTVLIEAQAMGLPIISTFHADIPEIVVNKKSGLLSEEHNLDGLIANLSSLLTGEYSWEEMGKYGRMHVEEHYNIATQVQLLEKRYARLCCNKI